MWVLCQPLHRAPTVTGRATVARGVNVRLVALFRLVVGFHVVRRSRITAVLAARVGTSSMLRPQQRTQHTHVCLQAATSHPSLVPQRTCLSSSAAAAASLRRFCGLCAPGGNGGGRSEGRGGSKPADSGAAPGAATIAPPGRKWAFLRRPALVPRPGRGICSRGGARIENAMNRKWGSIQLLRRSFNTIYRAEATYRWSMRVWWGR